MEEPDSSKKLSHKVSVSEKDEGLEMAQWLRALLVLAMDLGSVPSTQVVTYNHP